MSAEDIADLENFESYLQNLKPRKRSSKVKLEAEEEPDSGAKRRKSEPEKAIPTVDYFEVSSKKDLQPVQCLNMPLWSLGNVPECKYSVILDHVNELDWKLVDDEKNQNKVNLFWIDVASIHEHFRTILPWQCINHFPGMPNVARKNRMGQNLNKMQKIFPREYSFYPRTWILPSELGDFRSNFDNNGNAIGSKVFIIKPDAGCQGRGIFLTRTFENVPLQENVVAQTYIKKPLLIDGFKFDLRLYVLVAGVKPLRMYLFHDGLVRMCTEQYVKPSKANINMSCMHLTNYAVNKHNENFQQSSAKNSEECQDEGSKRSLLWFMNWVRADKGDAKADWLWKRFGVLCTRTVMSILPILSREYDQHFKGFNGIPVDISKLSTLSSTIPAAPPVTAEGGSSKNGRGGGVFSRRSVGARNSDNEEEEEDGNESDQQNSKAASVSTEQGGGEKESKEAADEEDSKTPKTRGSRCFEILGFDIMIDSNLKPWLIELNHLPSFGTDSLLDKDIKERLMEQVFSVLPVMADDQQAYQLVQKIESEKRLVMQRKQAEAKKEEKEKQERRSQPPPRKPPSAISKKENTPNGTSSEAAANGESKVVETKEPPPSLPAVVVPTEVTEEPKDCTMERLAEIAQILAQVYAQYSPEKISKIDRLLAKYTGHEEEFLRFVFAKYGVDPDTYKKPEPAPPEPTAGTAGEESLAASEAENEGAEESQREEGNGNESNEEGDKEASDVEERATMMNKPPSGWLSDNNRKDTAKRYSRSLSPPRSNTNRRQSAAWKAPCIEEDAAFRAEVLSQHIPAETEEWMVFEQSKLTQFTRIFPLDPHAPTFSQSASHGATHAGDASIKGEITVVQEELEGLREENEDDDDEEGGAGGTAHAGDADGAKAQKPIASYEDILFQIFVQDKRQTMRLRCPLPNRAKTDESFLPQIEPISSTSSVRSSFNTSGKGAVGWKAPPKPEKKENVKQVTANQADAAKRLSQGLSVAANPNASRSSRANAVVSSYIQYNPYAVVLDPHELSGGNSLYNLQDGNFNVGGALPNEVAPPAAWPSSKAARLLEESRINRMRLEAARANSAAVLRQQVFHFDPKYDTLNTAIGGNLFPGQGFSDNQSVSGGSVVGGGSIVGAQPPFITPNAPQQIPQQQQQQQQQGVRGRSSRSFGAGAPDSRVVGMGAGNNTQEELLKQLFPNWF